MRPAALFFLVGSLAGLPGCQTGEVGPPIIMAGSVSIAASDPSIQRLLSPPQAGTRYSLSAAHPIGLDGYGPSVPGTLQGSGGSACVAVFQSPNPLGRVACGRALALP